MSVPPDRMAARTPGTIKDPNKIMGMPKWVFFVIIAVGLVVAWYVWKRSQSTNAASLQTANAGTEPDTTNGVTAADIGGTPADNSFATQTDEMALEEQLQSMQNALFQLQQSNGGNGAGINTTGPGGSPGPTPTGVDITGSQTTGGQVTVGPPSPVMKPGGSFTGAPISFPITGPGTPGNPVLPPSSPVITPTPAPVTTLPGQPISVPVGSSMTYNPNVPSDIALVSAGIRPNPSPGHAVPY